MFPFLLSPACLSVSAIVWWNRCPHDLTGSRSRACLMMSVCVSTGIRPLSQSTHTHTHTHLPPFSLLFMDDTFTLAAPILDTQLNHDGDCSMKGAIGSVCASRIRWQYIGTVIGTNDGDKSDDTSGLRPQRSARSTRVLVVTVNLSHSPRLEALLRLFSNSSRCEANKGCMRSARG